MTTQLRDWFKAGASLSVKGLVPVHCLPDSLVPGVWFPQTKGCVSLGCFHGLYFTDSGVACMCPRPLGPRGPCCSAASIACRSPGALLLGHVHCLLLRRSLAVSVGARPLHRRSASPVPRVCCTLSLGCVCVFLDGTLFFFYFFFQRGKSVTRTRTCRDKPRWAKRSLPG